MNKHTQITKQEFYNSGGLSNPHLFRKATKSGKWKYYKSN
jgi:hypothetical protein